MPAKAPSVRRVKLSEFISDPANPRSHPDKAKKALGKSVKRFGAARSIVVDGQNTVRAGNGTIEAAFAAGIDEALVVETDGKELVIVRRPDWTPSEAAAYSVADNKAGDLSFFDPEALKSAFGELKFDEGLLDATGFEPLEIADLLREEGSTVEDEVPEPPKEAVSRLGDLWILGDHRLLCADSTDAEAVGRLMGGERAALCFTSPPYAQQRDYHAKITDWDGLMRGVFANLPMTPDGQVLVNLGLVHRDGEWWPYWDGWIEWMRGQGWRRFGLYAWDQGWGMPGDWNGRCAPSFEFIFHFNREPKHPAHFVPKKDENIGRGAGGVSFRYPDGTTRPPNSPDSMKNPNKIPDSVWRIKRASTGGRIESGHPACFPVALPGFAMECWPGDVYDPFSGAGTTIIAAEQLLRRAFCCELSPAYVDIAVLRYQNLTGDKATLDGTGETYDEVKAKRAAKPKRSRKPVAK